MDEAGRICAAPPAPCSSTRVAAVALAGTAPGGRLPARWHQRCRGRGVFARRCQRRCQHLTQHDQRRLEVGRAGRCRPLGQRGLQKQTGALERLLDVGAAEALIEAGALRQHRARRLLHQRRQACRTGGDAEIGEQRRQAGLLGRRGLGHRRHRQRLQHRQLGLRRGDRRRVSGRSDRRCQGDRVRGAIRRRGTCGRLACRNAGLLVDDREVDGAIGGLRNRKLQGLASLQRNLRGHIERLAADRDPYLVVAQELLHLSIDHRSRLQHDIGRNALRCDQWDGRIDDDRHGQRLHRIMPGRTYPAVLNLSLTEPIKPARWPPLTI